MNEGIANLPNMLAQQFDLPDLQKLQTVEGYDHPPRILLLYGSLRERSFSRFAIEEAARILEHMGAEVKIFNPKDLPIVGSAPDQHPKVQELRALSMWSEG